MANAPYFAFAVAAGLMLPFQFGINSVLARYVESPLRATIVSFAVGLAVLLVAALVFARGVPAWERVAGAPWWAWTGGFLGAFYVLGSVVTAPKLGAATLVALILAGQAAASLSSTTSALSASPRAPPRLGAPRRNRARRGRRRARPRLLAL